MTYYYDPATRTVRRYADNATGERFSKETNTWTADCCRRRACELTGDAVITESEALSIINGAEPTTKGK